MATDRDRIWNISEFTVDVRAAAELSGRQVIDLGQGTPTDPTPLVASSALGSAGNAPGYPPTLGTPQVRSAYRDWARRRLGADVPIDAVIPTIGSKELIAGLPELLNISAGSLVVVPQLSYPTYSFGARRVGAQILAADSLVAIGPRRPGLVWLNTPSNPTGRVLPAEHLRKVVEWARARDCLVASDECYLELGEPGQEIVSILSPQVNGGSLENILAVHSLSKTSSMAGYRIGFVAGDPTVVASLTSRRRDRGLMVPSPMQSVAAAVLADDEHVVAARKRYADRRLMLRSALIQAGFAVEGAQAGMFLWASKDEPDRELVANFARVGLVTAPGSFYGASGVQHVRLSLSAGDAQIEEAAVRIVESG
jgi:succinyldiaminopimelate transaminase